MYVRNSIVYLMLQTSDLDGPPLHPLPLPLRGTSFCLPTCISPVATFIGYRGNTWSGMLWAMAPGCVGLYVASLVLHHTVERVRLPRLNLFALLQGDKGTKVKTA